MAHHSNISTSSVKTFEELKNTIVCSISRYSDLVRHAEQDIDVVACAHIPDGYVLYINERGQVVKVYFEPDEPEIIAHARTHQ